MKKPSQTPVRSYDTDTELMKIIAACFVVLIHSSGGTSFSSVFFNAISRFSVPVFVMISGYYMLRRKPDGTHLVQKSIKLFVAMVIWAGIYYLYQLHLGEIPFLGIGDALRYLLTEPYHLWYIYAAIALYLFTPVLYVFHANATQREYRYALAVSLFLGSFVVIALRAECFPVLSVIISNTKAPYTLGFIFLYLLGAYLHKYEISSSRVRFSLYVCGLLGVLTTIFGTWMLPGWGLPSDLLISFYAPNVIAAAAAFFVLVQQLCKADPDMPQKLRGLVHKVAGCTMGVYFIHPLVLMILQRYVESRYFTTIPYLLIPQRALAAIVLSFLAVWIGRKIPVLKKLF